MERKRSTPSRPKAVCHEASIINTSNMTLMRARIIKNEELIHFKQDS